MPDVAVMAGCEPMTHVGSTNAGVLVLHGFTGNPSSMRHQAEAFAAAGFHVEQPRLPGHGTTLDDMMTTTWDDWSAEAAAAYDRLTERVADVVVMGVSMGGTLALWTALQRTDDERLRGLVCVNPATTRESADMRHMLTDFLDDGVDIIPGIGSDIADPGQVEISYDGVPVRQLLSLFDAKDAIADRYGELHVPLLLFTSHHDHVVPSDQSTHLAAAYGGTVDHVWLERSFHVATQDHDRDLIAERSIEFVRTLSPQELPS